MFTRKIGLILLTLLVALLCFASFVAAQETTNGTLQMGQPAIGYVASPELTLNYNYELAVPRGVSLQAIGDTARPRIAIYQNGELLASQPNAEGELIVNLTTFLNAGSYIVEVGITGGEPGMVILIVQNETPVTVTPLAIGTATTGEVNANAPLALYSFSALAEPAYLFIESGLAESGPNARLVDTATGKEIASLDSSTLGGRLRLPAGITAYQVEIAHDGGVVPVPYSVCVIAVSAGDCGLVSIPVAQTPEVQPPSDVCTVTPNSGGANIRQSASVNALLVGAMPGGATAEVLGISPDGSFYNITYNNITGWVALSVVNANGNCAGVPVINPPPVIPQPTIPPTATSTLPPSPIPPSPTSLPTLTPTLAGPCLITITGPQRIYTQPNAIPDYIYDQVQAGYQLIPVGRLADNTWWRTNYASAWIETSAFGITAQVTGDCSSLPIATP